MSDKSLEEKRELARRLLRERREGREGSEGREGREAPGPTYDVFARDGGADLAEVREFDRYVERLCADGRYPFESARLAGQAPEVELRRETGERIRALNLSSYNYLGYGRHPEVLAAAKDALDRYGLGAASSPVISGTFSVHKELEARLAEFFGLPGRGVSLFSSGYGVNLGAISALIKPGHHVVLDQAAHASIQEGAALSGGRVSYFRHNDVAHLDEVLASGGGVRTLVCLEGLYSADGDTGRVADAVRVARRHGALVLVDEAHSMLIAGPGGCGVAAAQGVLADVDLMVLTFSKSLAGVGGALYARRDIVRYVNWYARCRMFSCALDPAVTGGMLRALELASGPDGDAPAARVLENASLLRRLLAPHVVVGAGDGWVVPVFYWKEERTLALNDFLQREGLDTSIMQYPAVPRNESRIRLFVTAEHTAEHLERATAILVRAADRFGFRR